MTAKQVGTTEEGRRGIQLGVGGLATSVTRALTDHLRSVPEMLGQALSRCETLPRLAERFASALDVLYLGRNVHSPLALEGALKLNELSYIHTEDHTAGR